MVILKKSKKEYAQIFYRKNHVNFILTNLVLAFNAVLSIGIAFLLQQLMDIAAYGDTAQLVKTIVFTGIYLLVCCLTGMLERHFRNAFVQRAVVQFKEMLFRKLIDKNINTFDGDSTGRYISSLTNDVASVEQNYLEKIFSIVTNVLMFTCATAMMLWYDLRLTAISFAMCLISMVISMAIGSGIAAKEKDVSLKNESFVVAVKEILAGFSVIKSFKAEGEIENLFQGKNTSLELSKTARRKAEKTIYIISNGLAVVSQVVIIGFGAYLTIKGEITVGVLVAFIQLMNNVIYPIQSIPSDISNMNAAKAVLTKLSELFDTEVCEKGTELPDSPDIVFKNVTFGYSEDKTVLNGISCEFKRGRSYAIVGGSGCGKSTLLAMIMGGYGNYGGEILLGGKDLRSIAPESLYDLVTAIRQETFIFDSTLESNITMFRDFPKADIDSAVDMAGLRGLVSGKEQGFMCGENGCNLSGGERQRISIARGLLRRTPILLMDEITSSLDNETAYEVENAVLNLKNFTRIAVTHKLNENILKRYDEILVMKDGRIIERGTFSELMNAAGYFNSLYNISGI